MASDHAAVLLAPSYGASGAALRMPGRDEPLPAVDERLVAPGGRHEILDGQLLFTPPADEAHGTLHFDLTYILGAYVASGFRGAVDMLTRTSPTADHAPDASIFPAERDPETGGRKLEHIAFEVVSEQAMSVPTRKARRLAERGVRRIFCLEVAKRRVLEWSQEADAWTELSPSALIEDRCLVRPLPARTLLDAALADDAVARALLAKGNRVLQAAIAEGETKVLAAALLGVLAARGFHLTEEQQAQVLTCTHIEQLNRWIARAAVASSLEEALGEGR